jgi:hypothetical protein
VKIKKYTNDLLEKVISNYKYLESRFPNITYDKTVGSTIILQDSTDGNNTKPVLVKPKEGSEGYMCKEDKSETCEHVLFSMLCPDIVHPL